MSSPLELRIERIKRFSNLRLQLLQSVYIHDGRSIAELYMSGETILHIHGLFGVYRFCAALRNGIHSRGFAQSKLPVFVRVGEALDALCPVASVIRLQPLDNCDMFIADTFEKGITPSFESLFGILNRKLCFLDDLFGIELSQLIDKVIQGSSQVVDDFSNEDLDDMGDRFVWEGCNTNYHLNLSTIWQKEGCWIAINDSVITHSLTESVDPAIEIRQVYACPSNPLISAIEWVHSITIQRNEHIA